MPEEVRKLDNKKCLVFIRGFDPILDGKYVPFNHPMFPVTADGDGEPYIHVPAKTGERTEPFFSILSEHDMKYYREQKEKGEPVYIDSLSYEEFCMLGQQDLEKRFMELDEEIQKEKYREEQQTQVLYEEEMSELEAQHKDGAGEMAEEEDSVFYRLIHMPFTKEQKAEVKRAMDVHVPMNVILSYFYPDTPVTQMMEIRRKYEE